MAISNDKRTVVPQSKPVLTWTIARPAQIRGLAVALSIALLAAACSAPPPLQSDDPQVQAAQHACKDVPDPERFACIEQHAIATLNPDVCRLIGIAVDDACLQSVYEAADDPAICDRLYLPGVIPTCKAYYADPSHTPRRIFLLTPTPIPDDARLGWLSYVLDGDIWIKYLPDGQPQRITDDGVNDSPRWSPSGRWLAFRKRDSQLWLHSLETGQAWAVDEGAPSTSSTGRRPRIGWPTAWAQTGD